MFAGLDNFTMARMFLLFLFGLSTSALPIKDQLSSKSIRVQIQINDDSNFGGSNHWTDEEMPNFLNLKLDTEKHQVQLRLTKLPLIRTTIVETDGPVEHTFSLNNAAVYLDPERGASVIAKRRPHSEQLDLEGRLHFNGQHVNLIPLKMKNSSADHIIEPLSGNLVFKESDVFHEDTGFHSDHYDNIRERMSRKKRSVDQHTIEVIFIVDERDYKRWMTKLGTNKQETLDHMKLYYTAVAAGMNARYANVEKVLDSLSITIAVTEIRIITDPIISNFTTFIGDDETNLLKAASALSSFREWVLEQDYSSLPQNDHYILFTGYDLTNDESGKGRSGIAVHNSTCERYSVSVIEDNFGGATDAIAAHELGHSLNSDHDSDKTAIDCPDASNIMATILKFVSVDRRSNPWQWTKCSVENFKDFLNREGVDCTKKQNSSPPVNYSAVRYGQKFSADKQCQHNYGTNFCRPSYSATSYDTLCFIMWCYDPKRSNKCVAMYAMEYTTCGNQKWCVQGQCVEAPEHVRAYEDCPHGDDPDYNCSPERCPFLPKKGKQSYCCSTCNSNITTAAPSTTTSPTTTTTTTTTTTPTPTTTSTTTTTKPTTTTTTTTTTAAKGQLAEIQKPPQAAGPAPIVHGPGTGTAGNPTNWGNRLGENAWYVRQRCQQLFRSYFQNQYCVITMFFPREWFNHCCGDTWNNGGNPLNTGGTQLNNGAIPWNNGGTQWNNAGIQRNGGNTQWNGGNTQWNGGNTQWNGGNTQWNGGNTQWNGGNTQWNGGNNQWNNQWNNQQGMSRNSWNVGGGDSSGESREFD